jgi:hypothetical protein
MLTMPVRPFTHHRSLQRVMQMSQNDSSCPPAELDEFNPQRSLDRLEIKEPRGRLVV